jgi:hypothetical protein
MNGMLDDMPSYWMSLDVSVLAKKNTTNIQRYFIRLVHQMHISVCTSGGAPKGIYCCCSSIYIFVLVSLFITV